MRTSTKAVLAGVTALAVAAPFAAHGASSKSVTVKNFKFTPATITIHKGDSVAWRFKKDPKPHNVTGKGGIRSAKKISTGTYRKTFKKAGTYSYICTIHPNMKGKVVVR
jgi:plastocyanin